MLLCLWACGLLPQTPADSPHRLMPPPAWQFSAKGVWLFLTNWPRDTFISHLRSTISLAVQATSPRSATRTERATAVLAQPLEALLVERPARRPSAMATRRPAKLSTTPSVEAASCADARAAWTARVSLARHLKSTSTCRWYEHRGKLPLNMPWLEPKAHAVSMQRQRSCHFNVFFPVFGLLGHATGSSGRSGRG